MNPEPLDLEEGRALLDAMTLGPWRDASLTHDGRDDGVFDPSDDWVLSDVDPRDAAAIVWLRNNGAALLAEAARSQQLADALTALLTDRAIGLADHEPLKNVDAPDVCSECGDWYHVCSVARARALLPMEGV